MLFFASLVNITFSRKCKLKIFTRFKILKKLNQTRKSMKFVFFTKCLVSITLKSTFFYNKVYVFKKTAPKAEKETNTIQILNLMELWSTRTFQLSIKPLLILQTNFFP